MDRNCKSLEQIYSLQVALRKESVDRNNTDRYGLVYDRMSLSARRAWIEMIRSCRVTPLFSVALRKESVDRNVSLATIKYADPSRSPQGERG